MTAASKLKGARILVAGGTGFLGRHVSSFLKGAGALVVPVCRSLGYDLTSEARALSAVLVGRPDVVVHLAGPKPDGATASSVRDPIQIGLNLVSACAMAQSKLVIVSRQGRPGSASDAVAQALLAAARAARKEHGLPFVQVLPCEVYGPGDRRERERLLPYVIARILEAKASGSKKIVLEGSPRRPFPLLYAEDAAAAVAVACALPGCDEPLPVCGLEAPRLEEVSQAAARAAGFKGAVEWDPETDRWAWAAAPYDGAAAREVLGWGPATPLEEGVKSTAAWLMKEAASQLEAIGREAT